MYMKKRGYFYSTVLVLCMYTVLIMTLGAAFGEGGSSPLDFWKVSIAYVRFSFLPTFGNSQFVSPTAATFSVCSRYVDRPSSARQSYLGVREEDLQL